MEKDLKFIKKHYGENMMKMCREMFPRILETEGLLSKILFDHFSYNKNLFEDIINERMQDDFKSYIYSFVDVEQQIPTINKNQTAVILMDKAGYILYPECKTEEDIQSFKKYYKSGEQLCTFKGGRLDNCRVWFAVKKDVDNIKRENFDNPKRQDEYGTSVISIQFTKGNNSTLSIKNRYNHTVNNCDNTFNSNLDNIIEGLTDAFERDYNVKDDFSDIRKNKFELKNYVNVNGKYYKFNYEINNIYYCDNNIIIDNFEVKKLSDNYILADYFIFDKHNKTVKLYDKKMEDSFVDSFGEIKNIDFINNKIIVKVEDGEDIIVGLNNNRQIKTLNNPNITKIGNAFLFNNKYLTELFLENLISCGNSFLFKNKSLQEISLPSMIECGSRLLCRNEKLTKFDAPNLAKIADAFLTLNKNLKELSLPNLTECGRSLLYKNENLTKFDAPNLARVGEYFLWENKSLQEISLPRMIECGDNSLYYNTKIAKFDAPNLAKVGNNFLFSNKSLQEISLPNMTECGRNFLYNNIKITKFGAPNLVKAGDCFLYSNKNLKEISLPKLTECGDDLLFENEILTKFEAPNLIKIKNNFLSLNKNLKEISLPSLTQCGRSLLYANEKLTKFYAPNLKRIRNDFLWGNKSLKEISLSSLIECGDNLLCNNQILEKFYAPNLKKSGNGFLKHNTNLKTLYIPKSKNRPTYYEYFLKQHPNREEFINMIKQRHSDNNKILE